MSPLAITVIVVAVILLLILLKSMSSIGPTEIGLVTKKVSRKKLSDGNPIAMDGQAGFQADLLMPGLRFRLWPIFGVQKYPWVQVPAGEIGVVIAQVGEPLAVGAKSGVYRAEFGNFNNVRTFLAAGGQKGVQRPVLPPGTLLPIHPVAFLVVTSHRVYGAPVDAAFVALSKRGPLTAAVFGLAPEHLQVVQITPQGQTDLIGVVTALEGPPLDSGDIACRIGAFDDILVLEQGTDARPPATDAEIIEVLLGSRNVVHNNYQDFQAFLDRGGKIGLQHDPLLYGAYLLNPFLVRVELVPMLVVNQGEVAVVKAFVGLPTSDTSGSEFKFGSIVRPGHRGIWQEPLRTGKYAINPRVYAAEIVPTSILTLNWAAAVSQAHNLDAQLSPIEGKSREGFIFRIDLQVQIHVPDTKAPKVISMVGTMQNLVNEVLQSAVGNHFRNTLQRLEAIRFIETRDEVQAQALDAIMRYLGAYEVETRGVYIQDVEFPPELVKVLTEREIANQEKSTFEEQQRAQIVRVDLERARGTANMQAQLAQAQVSVEISRNQADAREANARGEAAFVELTGRAEATKVEAIGLATAKATEALGLARAEGYKAQVDALGQGATAIVTVANAVSEGKVNVVPEVLVTGGSGGVDGLAAVLMRYLTNGAGNGHAPGRTAGGNAGGATLPAISGNDTPPSPAPPEPPMP